MIPPRGKLIGVDVGTVRVGLAVCDPDRLIATPLETYSRQNEEHDAQYFDGLVNSQKIVGFVVGLAILLNGDEGPKAKECRAFGDWLQQITGLPVEYIDERFTTAAAEDVLRELKVKPALRKRELDKRAAQFILQSFLDSQPRNSQHFQTGLQDSQE